MKCKICSSKIIGRTDKIFCSVKCKNYYHINLRKTNKKETIDIDIILHRNRTILLEILGKRENQIKVKRVILVKKGFHFKYLTHFHVNSRGKMYNHIYDFAWMEFSDDEILIVRR